MNTKENILSLIKKRTIIFDGAMGTVLISKGLERGTAPELWNLEHSDIIKEIHQSYFSSGSDVVQTNTFGGNRIKLASLGLDSKLEEINTTAVRLALSVCPSDKYVAGDIGPTGKFLSSAFGESPLSPLNKGGIKGGIQICSKDEMESAFSEQAEILANAGVDLISIETMYDLQEASLAVKSASSTGLPVFASMTFNKTKRGFFTMMGVDVPTAIKTLADSGANVIGANCTLYSKDMIELADVFLKHSTLPVIIQPNAGQPRLKNGAALYEQTPEDFANDVKEIINKGVKVIGGCCGTTPKFIEKLSLTVKSYTVNGHKLNF